MKTIFKNENKHLVACLTPDTDTERTIIQHLYESGYVAKINGDFVVTITETNIDLEEEMYKKIIAIVSDYGVKFDAVIESAAAVIDQTHNYSQILSDDGTTNLTQDLDSITKMLADKVNIDDGVLHLLADEVSGPYSACYVNLNGTRIDLEPGEHFIKCPKGSLLSAVSGIIGIYRFDGTITKPINHGTGIIFINNTRVEIKESVWFDGAHSLQNLDGVICRVPNDAVYSSQSFAGTALTSAPYIYNTKNVTNLDSMYRGCRNLRSIPHYDTSNVTSWREFVSGCISISILPYFDTSKAIDISAMFYRCYSIVTIPSYDFRNVTIMSRAFAEMSSLKSYAAPYPLAKVTTADFAFAAHYDYSGKQPASPFAGNLLTFANCQLPECTNLNGAWQYQNRLVNIGVITIPKCTILGDAFRGCSELTHIGGFEGLMCDINMEDCPNITTESWVNIFTMAANITAIGSRSIRIHTISLARLTDAQKTIATDKGWTLMGVQKLSHFK